MTDVVSGFLVSTTVNNFVSTNMTRVENEGFLRIHIVNIVIKILSVHVLSCKMARVFERKHKQQSAKYIIILIAI